MPGSLTLRPALWLAHLLISKLLKLLWYVQQRKYRDLRLSSVLRSGATQLNLSVSHLEDAAIEYTGLHRLFIKKPWLDFMNV